MGVLLVAYCLLGIRKGAVGLVHLYHQDVQDRCVELGLTTYEQIKKRKSLFKAGGIVAYVVYILACVYWINRVQIRLGNCLKKGILRKLYSAL